MSSTEELRGYPLAVEALAHITLDPPSHLQEVWAKVEVDGDFEGADPIDAPGACATRFCLAGWVNILAGRQTLWRLHGNAAGSVWYGDFVNVDGLKRSQETSATDLLELEYQDPSQLFYGPESVPGLVAAVAELYDTAVPTVQADVDARVAGLAATTEFEPGQLGLLTARAHHVPELPS